MSELRVVGGGDEMHSRTLLLGCAIIALLGLASCNSGRNGVVQADAQRAITVGVTPVVRKALDRHITLSSELVPFQEIDVYAKESGYVRKLNVDYGTRVKAGQVMAVLEIPELEAQLDEDKAQIKNGVDEVNRAQHELARYQAQYKALHLEYTRLNAVFESKPGIVAQQDVDNAQGQDLAAAAQVDAGQAALQAAQSHLAAAKAKLTRDQTLYDYSRITAPFSGVVTQRYANLGTLMQAGTGSSTQALPLVRLSEDDLFRLVIPVPEAYVRYIRIGDPVTVNVPSLDHSFPGRVARFSVDVREDTRTMHTEVDVPNPQHVLMPGLYADAILALERRQDALVVPVQALNHEASNQTTVFLVNDRGELEDRPVQLGITTANDAEVVSGLKEGDKVVVSDRSGLKSGQKVQAQFVQTMQYHEESTQQ